MRNSAVRFAALIGCALIPLLAQAAQLPLPSVKPLPKDRPILLQVDELVYDSEHHRVSAVGHVEISDEDRTLLAERVDVEGPRCRAAHQGQHVLVRPVEQSQQVDAGSRRRRRAAADGRATRSRRAPCFPTPRAE